jgi:hypothetical protein
MVIDDIDNDKIEDMIICRKHLPSIDNRARQLSIPEAR